MTDAHADSSAAPRSADDLPFEDGSFVELHSLKREEMNGFTGEITGFDETAKRHQLLLDNDNKTILVKPMNLRRIPLVSQELRNEAFNKGNQINYMVQTAYQNGSLASILAQVRNGLQECIAKDPCCVMAHACLGQCATMVRDREAAVKHMKRAVGNIHASVSNVTDDFEILLRCELANCLGEMRNLEAEAWQLGKVLECNPKYIRARFSLGQNLVDQKRVDDGIDQFQAVLDAEDDDESSASDEQEQLIKHHIRNQLAMQLERRIFELSDPNDNDPQKTIDYAERIVALGVDLSTEAKTMVLAHKAVAFARLERWEEAIECIREANDHGASESPRIKCGVLHHGGNIQELRGDHAFKANYSAMARACWEEAMALYEASEETMHDDATQVAHLRVQVKLNDELAKVIDESGEVVGGMPMDGSVLLNILPRGPDPSSSEDSELQQGTNGREGESPVLFV